MDQRPLCRPSPYTNALAFIGFSLATFWRPQRWRPARFTLSALLECPTAAAAAPCRVGRLLLEPAPARNIRARMSRRPARSRYDPAYSRELPERRLEPRHHHGHDAAARPKR